MTESIVDAWLSIPQAVFYLVTGDLKQARSLRPRDPEVLVYCLARELSPKIVATPLPGAATTAQLLEARQTLIDQLAHETTDTDKYSSTCDALTEHLADGRVTAKGSRTSDGPLEPIDAAEFTRLRLRSVHAVCEKTQQITWYNLLVSARDLLASWQSIGGHGAPHPADTLRGGVGQNDRKTPERRLPRKWRDAREAAMKWLDDYGCPERGDGNQAKLERYIAAWLGEHGYEEVGESTIRRHVARSIQERREKDLRSE